MLLTAAALLFVTPAYAQSVTGTITVGNAPAAAAVNPLTNTIYILNSSDGTVSAINGATGQVIGTAIDVGSNPVAVAVNTTTNTIYVANKGSANVTPINGATNVAGTPIPVGTNPVAIAVNPVTKTIYVANSGSNNVTPINGATNVAGTPIPVGTNPVAIAVNPVTNTIYVANNGSNNVTPVNGGTNVPGAPIPAGTNPIAIAVNPASGSVYVANNGSSNVTPISGNTAGAAIAAGTNPIAIAVNPVTGTIYVANNGSGNITVINGTTNVPSIVTDPNASAPIAVALNLTTNTVYVANNGSANVFAINGATNTVAATLSAGTNPTAIAVNPVTGMAYVANNGSANVTVISSATYAVSSISDSSFSSPNAIAVNPVTNEVYVANDGNSSNNTISVINPANNNSVSTITDSSAVGPTAVAVNPVTNTIYVADQTSGTITEINAANNNQVTTITPPGTSQPVALALNPVTNTIYVANSATNNVTVINAANSNHLTVISDPSALGPAAVAVNPATGQVYVANSGSDNVSVFDGATGLYVASITVGTYPQAIAVNPATNTVYVANSDSSNVTVINGATNLVTTTVAVSNSPVALSVNPISNQIYVADAGNETGNVVVINGATNVATTISSASLLSPNAIAVNPTTNTIYVANYDGDVTAIDGVTETPLSVMDANAQQAFAVTVNPLTNDAYVANFYSDNATAVAEQTVQINALHTTISALTNNQTSTETPSFSFTVTNGLTANAADDLVYQIDSWTGTWNTATAGTSPNAFSASVATPLEPGFHILYAFATDGEDGTSVNTGAQSSPLIGTISAYGFLVAPQVATALPPALTFATQTEKAPSTAQTAFLVNDGAATLTFSYGFSGANSSDFAEGSGDTCSTQGGTLAAGASCSVLVIFTPTTASSESASLVFTDNSNGISGSMQSVALSGTGSALPTYTLNIGESGFGSGTVTSNPTGITCQPTCSASYPSGTQITLTEAPGAGSGFVQWSGACTGSATTCTFTISANATVTAAFSLSGATSCTGATTNWAGGTGNWSNPANWVGGSVPASGASVCIADGTPGTSAVTLDVNPTVGNLYIDSGNSVTIANNTSLTITGTISNSGQILISAGSTTAALIISGGVTLTGGGTVTMSTTGAGIAYIYQYGGSTLTNVNNTIQGTGEIGYNGLTVVNGAVGVIDANSSGNDLYMNPAGLTNQGLLEATNGGILQLVGGVNFDNAGAHITSSGIGSMVQFLAGPTILGGTLTTTGGGTLGTLVSGNSATLDASTHGAITFVGTYSITNNTSTYALGAISNTGVIQIAAGTTTAALIVEGSLSLTGGGTVTMSTTGAGGAYIYQYGGSTLTNVNNTIQGTGEIGYNGLAVVNEASGVINANSTGVAMYVNPAGLTNQGLLEATNGGILQLVGGVNFDNAGAHITSSGTGSMVQFLAGPTIQGGTLTTTGGGTLGTLVSGNSATLDASTHGPITIVGNYSITNNTSAYVEGTISNTGVIQIAADTTTAALIIEGSVTLTGSGTVTMSTTGNGGGAYIYQYGGSTLTNVNNLIQGAGEIGYNGLAVVNAAAGVINANISGQDLYMNPAGLTNQGLLEATNGGILQLAGGVNFNNTGAHITSSGTGSTVELLGGPTIQGGTLTTAAGGTFGILVSGNNATLDASSHGAITIIGTYSITNNTSTYVEGTINNTGVIQITAGTTTAALIVEGNVSLTGGGTVTMSTTGAGGAYIYQYGGSTLTNVNNLIQGAGEIGYNGLAVVNQASGVIDSNGTPSGSALYLNPSSLTNQGLLEATNSAVLQLAGGENFNNSSGNILANGSSSMVQLLSGPTIQGGTLTTTGGGTLGTLVSGNNATLDGSTHGAITIVGSYSITNNTSTYAFGTINNIGAIQITAGTTTAALIVQGSLALSGGGTVAMSTTGGGGSAYIYQYGGSTLTNVNNTIQGTGVIGYNGLAVVNEGTINANSAGAALQITTASFANQGLLESTGTGILQVSSPITNSGEIVPDGSPNPGSISISSNYTQTSTGGEGVVLGGLTAGTQYSQLNISGTATLSGALNIGVIGGFAPTNGEQFTILTAGSISGTFSSINSVAVPGITWQVTYNTSSNPQSVVLTAGAEPTSSQTLAITELGTGSGSVIDDFEAINCSETNGVQTGSCSANYLTGATVTLWATQGSDGSTFIGWGGACASSGTSPSCSVTMTSAQNVTANFAAAPMAVNVTFPAGTNSTQMATFSCPSNPNPTPANPCTDPNAHAVQLSIPNVNTAFTVTVLATEVPPSQFDGLCEVGDSVLNDFDCRFVTFFGDGLDPNGDTITPLCYPYLNGNCVHYLVYSGAPGIEPNPSFYSGGVFWNITWNNDTFVAPGPYWTGSTPRLFDDPDSPPSTSAAYGTTCGQPMIINGVDQSYSCQFEFDITTFFDPTKKVDSGIGGSTKQFNDVVVAFPPTAEIPPNQAPVFTSATSTTMTVGTAAIFLVTATGHPAATLGESGALPNGVTLSTGTGILAGTPVSGSGGVYTLTLTASNGVSPSATQTFTLTVDEPPTITSAAAATFALGSNGSFTVIASGFPSSTFSESGALPNGVLLNPTTGVLGGTPTVAGSFSIQITAGNGIGSSATQSFTLTVNQAEGTNTLSVTELGTGTGVVTDVPMQISCSEANGIGSGTCSSSYSTGAQVILTAAATSPSTFAGWGGACAGSSGTSCTLTMNSNLNVTANFIPPPALVNVTFPVGANSTGMAAFDCPNNPNPTPANPCTMAQGPNAHALQLTIPNVSTGFTVTIQATEVPPSMADGLCEVGNTVLNDFDCRFVTFFSDGLDPNNNAIVPLCYPYANGNCVHYLVYSVGSPGVEPNPSDYSGGVFWVISWNDDTFVAPGPYWTGSTPQLYDDPDYAPLPGSAVGTSCSQQMTINGVGTGYSCQFEYNITTFFDPTKQVDSGIGGSTKQFNDVVVAFPPTSAGSNPVTPPPAATSPAIAGACVTGCTNGTSTITISIGAGATFLVTPTGYPAPTLTESGVLPSGLTFNGLTGILGGTLATGTTGSFPISFSATNSAGTTTQGYTLTINQGPAFTSAASTTFTVGTPGTFTVTASGTPAPAIAESGTLPNLVSFNATTGVLSGTPAANTGGTYSVMFTASNGVGSPAVQTFTLTVDQAPAITSGASATFTTGTAGSFSVAATGFPAPALGESGALPSGVTFNTSTGALSGTPAAGTGGTYSISITAGNGVGSGASQTFTLTVDQAPAVTSSASATFTAGTIGTFTVTATGFPKPAIAESGTLPSGVTFNTATGVLSGTPASGTPGTYPLTFTASNGVGSNATQSFTLTVAGASVSALTFSPASLNFGTVYAGNFALRLLTITNSGTAMVTFTNFSVAPISGDDSPGFLGIELCPRTLNAGKSCVIIMGFTADLNVTKAHAANLVIADNAPGSPQIVPLSATVINPQVSLGSNSLLFGNQKTGTTSAAKSVTLKNSGTTPLILSGLAVSGNFAPAPATTCTRSTTLAPQATCVISVTFTPTSKGPKTGDVTITDNAWNSPQYIFLSGSGN